MRAQAAVPVIVAAAGREWHRSWREQCARYWRVIDDGAAGEVFKEIRRADARIVVLVFLPDACRLDLLQLLCGAPHRIRIVAVATVHRDGLERDIRACGVACYVPLTHDFVPVLRAVEELMAQIGEPPIATRTRPVQRVARNASFPPPLMGHGRRVLSPAAHRERGGRKQNP